MNLVNHALLISDKTGAVGDSAAIKVSGKYKTEDDVSITIKPNNIELMDPRRGGITATLAAGNFNLTSNAVTSTLNANGLKVLHREDTNGDGQIDVTSYSTYGLGRITHNGNKLLFPEKEGTIALTSDLPATQQWTLVSTTGTVTTVNICVK